MHTLQKADTFTNFKEFLETITLHLDSDWDFLLCLQLDYSCLSIDVLDDTWAAFKLPRVNFAPITNLDSQLRIIPHCL